MEGARLAKVRRGNQPVFLFHWPSKAVWDSIPSVGLASLGAGGAGGLAARALVARAPLAGFAAAPAIVPMTLGLGLDKWRRKWNKAVRNADLNSFVLAGLLQTPELRGALLVGHSLGGRIVLKASEHLGRLADLSYRGTPARVAGVLALAAAAGQAEIDFELVAKGAESTPEVFFSKYDTVLFWVFRGIEWEASPVGLTGAPDGCDSIRSVDASRIGGRKVRHASYSSRLVHILQHSEVVPTERP